MDDRAEGWRRHAEEQRRAWRKLTYLERLRWLEQAKQFQRQALGAARRRSPRPDSDPEKRSDPKIS